MELQVNLNSEVGRLRAVVLHRPGPELEKMAPSTIHQALYSDLLDPETARKEYRQLEAVLGQASRLLYIDDLVQELLETNPQARSFLLSSIADACPQFKKEEAETLPAGRLAELLVQGMPGTGLNPLYNLYFTRDIGVCFNNRSMPAHMATQVRSREILLADALYRFHPLFARNSSRVNPWEGAGPAARFEGGDFQVCDKDVFVVGQGARTNRNGLDAFIAAKRQESGLFHVITQELPFEPESFIHLDMVFTFLDRTHCMAYKPLVFDKFRYQTRLLKVENGVVREEVFDTIFDALHSLGYDYSPVFCGNDLGEYPEREQWHSGANFFAFAPGKIIGYGRNRHTIEALSNAGYEVVRAGDVLDGKVAVGAEDDGKKAVYTLESSELVRGGGGCRCMTMPVCREDL